MGSTVGKRIGFRVDRRVIPVGVRCGGCGVCHLPAVVIIERGAGEAGGPGVLRLRCPRCSAVSEVALVGGPEDAELLAVLGVDWRDDGTGGARAG